MEIDKIQWKNRFPSKGVSPERAYSAIEKIRQSSGGRISPEAVIEAASSSRNPLHKLFEWDDTTAAKKFRIDQARTMFRCLEIVYVDRPDQPVRSHEIIFHSVRGKSKKENVTLYSTHEEVLADPVAREALIKEALDQLQAWRKRFQDLSEFAKICEVIEETLQETA